MKYWQKVKVTSWFYEGRYWYIVEDKNIKWFYCVKTGCYEWENCIHETMAHINESDLDIIDKDKAKKEYAQKISDMFYEKAKDLELIK